MIETFKWKLALVNLLLAFGVSSLSADPLGKEKNFENDKKTIALTDSKEYTKGCDPLSYISTPVQGRFHATDSRIVEASDGDTVECLLGIDDPQASSLRKTIVFFDCDDVLHKNHDAILQKEYIMEFLNSLDAEKKLTSEIRTEVIQGGKKVVVDTRMKSLISRLRDNGIPTFVLTQCSSDDKTRQWRKETLKALGYDIEQPNLYGKPANLSGAQQAKKTKFQSFVTPPVYDEGIVFTGSFPKGEILKIFLNWLYSHDAFLKDFYIPISDLQIVLIDDSRANLDSVAIACQQLGVRHFLGINFTAVEHDLLKIDRPISRLQKNVLLERGVWIADKDAGFLHNAIYAGIARICDAPYGIHKEPYDFFSVFEIAS